MASPSLKTFHSPWKKKHSIWSGWNLLKSLTWILHKYWKSLAYETEPDYNFCRLFPDFSQTCRKSLPTPKTFTRLWFFLAKFGCKSGNSCQTFLRKKSKSGSSLGIVATLFRQVWLQVWAYSPDFFDEKINVWLKSGHSRQMFLRKHSKSG